MCSPSYGAGMTTTQTPSLSTPLSRTVRARLFRAVVYLIAGFQFVLGVGFLVAPGGMARLLGLAAAPGWTGWLFAMMAARFLGYGVGMLCAARDPQRHRLWLDSMVVVQALDWVATVGYLVHGDVTLSQVTTAAFLPVLFVVGLLVLRPRVQ